MAEQKDIDLADVLVFQMEMLLVTKKAHEKVRSWASNLVV